MYVLKRVTRELGQVLERLDTLSNAVENIQYILTSQSQTKLSL